MTNMTTKTPQIVYVLNALLMILAFISPHDVTWQINNTPGQSMCRWVYRTFSLLPGNVTGLMGRSCAVMFSN